ncbi:methylesterase [Trifolium pratense]|uniref:Methylesterase n=1 Tax=Trifolium pratense TaxID=57577 RepID=A0A2K3MC24_TRIPR|nr:methylesterase [Trifolium pratense]
MVDQDSTLAAMLLRPGPLLAIISAQFKVENVEVEKVPRVYIRTSHDNVVKPKQQEAMINRWPPSNVYELDSDHSPFFSAPFLLFGFLVKAAISYVGCN